MAGRLCALAHISAVWPRHFSLALTLAPWATRTSAAATISVRATVISAVCPCAFGRLDIRAGVQQHSQCLRISALGGFGEGRGTIIVGDIRLGPGLEQTPDQRQVIVIRRPMQRRGAIILTRIDIGVAIDQRHRCGGIPGLGHIQAAKPRHARPGHSTGRRTARSAPPPPGV